jgi:hypothetical protein
MISIEDSVPKKSDAYLRGVDIFFDQFNDINFYFEDEGKENFYIHILKKLFPTKEITKVFALRGKTSVIEESKKNINSKKHIYILDKDFDDILGKKVVISNLFYLDRYSIENFLIEDLAFSGFVIEQKPTLKKSDINRQFKIKQNLKTIAPELKELTILYIIAQKNKLPIMNCALKPERFCQDRDKHLIDSAKISSYRTELLLALNAKDRRLTIKGQIKAVRLYPKAILEFIVRHSPGKYILYFFKEKIQSVFKLASVNIDSFVFRLIKNSNLETLTPLKALILAHMD